MKFIPFAVLITGSIGSTAYGEQAYDRLDTLKSSNLGQYQDIAVKVKSCRFEKSENLGTTEVSSLMCELQGSGQVQFVTFDNSLAQSLTKAGPQTLSGTVVDNQPGTFIVLRAGELDKYVAFVASAGCRQIEQREGWGQKIRCDSSKVKDCDQALKIHEQKLRSKIDQQCGLMKKNVQDLVIKERAKKKALNSKSH